MKRVIVALVLSIFTLTLAAPVVSVVTSTEAAAWGKKKNTCWRTNRATGGRFRIC